MIINIFIIISTIIYVCVLGGGGGGARASVCVYVYECVRACMRVRARACLRACVCGFAHTRVYVCARVSVCVCIVCVRVHSRAHSLFIVALTKDSEVYVGKAKNAVQTTDLHKLSSRNRRTWFTIRPPLLSAPCCRSQHNPLGRPHQSRQHAGTVTEQSPTGRWRWFWHSHKYSINISVGSGQWTWQVSKPLRPVSTGHNQAGKLRVDMPPPLKGHSVQLARFVATNADNSYKIEQL